MSGLEELVAQRRMQTEEELLEYQRQFQQGGLQSSTKVIRAVRKKPADSSASNSSTSADAKPAAAAAAVPAPAAAAPAEDDFEPEVSTESLIFHTAAAVPERAAVAPPRAAFGAGSVAAARTGFPAAFRADLRPQQQSAGASAPAAAAATAAGAPGAGAAAAPAKKKSLFAQQRDRMLAQQQAASAAANPAPATSPAAAPAAVAPAVVQREVVSFAAGPQQATLSQPAAIAAAQPASSSSRPAAAPATMGVGAARAPLAESRGIHEENMVKLDGMSIAEIEEAQRELERMLPPELVAMLRAKRAGGGAGVGAGAGAGAAGGSVRPPQPTPDASYPTPAQLNEYLLDEALLGGSGSGGQGDDVSDDDDEDEEEDGMDDAGGRVEGVQQRLRLDQQLEAYAARLESRHSQQAQADKLAWSAPIEPSAPVAFPATVDGYNNDAPVWNSFRVDFEGRFIVPDSAASAASAAGNTGAVAPGVASAALVSESVYSDPSNALYHHGDEADRPGYTMRELLHLARSTVMSQRTLSMQVLARVLQRVRADEYVYPAPVAPTPRALMPAVEAYASASSSASSAIPSFSHLLFSHLLYLNLVTLLRLSLDDNRNPAGVLATLHCFESVLYRTEDNETPLLLAQAAYKGHQRGARFTQDPSLATEIDKKNNPKDTKLADNEEDESGVRAEEKDQSRGEESGVSDNARDEEMCARDLVVGLASMQFLERIRYILEVYALPAALYRANPPTGNKGAAAAAAKAAGAAGAAGVPTMSDATAGLVLLSPIFHILLSFAQHSPQASSKLFDTPRLKETIVKIVSALASVVAAESASVGAGIEGATVTGAGAGPSSLSISSLSSTLHTSLLLLGVLCQVHRDMCHYFLTRGGLFSSFKKFIVLPNGLRGMRISAAGAGAGAGADAAAEEPEGAGVLDADDAEMSLLLPLSIQTLHLWRVCLAYGLDIEAYMDHFPVLLDVLSRTPLFVQRAFTVPIDTHGGRRQLSMRVGELWMQQLRAVVSVVEGLTLLFTPAPAAASSLPTGSLPGESSSAPPVALSFELTHVVHAVEIVLSNLASVWFAQLDEDEDESTEASAPLVSLRASMHETLASFMHLLASYYAVLPGQSSFEWGLCHAQVEKHTSMCFETWTQSPLLANAIRLVERVDSEGIASVLRGLGAGGASLPFTNLPQSLPDGIDRPVQQALNALFALLRWQESLLSNVPRAPAQPLGAGSASAQQAAVSAEVASLASIMRRVLASSRSLRQTLLSHFYSTTPAMSLALASTSGAGAGADGPNRVASRKHILSPMESEMVVTLLVLDRMDSAAAASADPSARAAAGGSSSGGAESPTDTARFYQRTLQLIPSLLRNGQQFLASKLLSDVLFNASMLNQLVRSTPSTSGASASTFTFAQTKLLHDLYAHFCYFPEELLVSTLLHTSSLMTPTLCAPVAGATNIVAHLDTSTGARYAVRTALIQSGASEGEWTSGAWPLNMLRRGRFLHVQIDKKHVRSSNTRLESVLTLLRYFRALDDSLGLFTPPPPPPAAGTGAHPMSTLFLRALMEFYLLSSDVFLEPPFISLVGHFLHRLFDGPSGSAARTRSLRWIGAANHASSTLMFGASIAAPSGDASIRTQGNQMVQLVAPEQQGVQQQQPMPSDPSSASGSGSASGALSSLVPFHDFHSPLFPTSLWGASFYPFYKDLVEAFVADSMGDTHFARIILLFARGEYPLDYRLVLWRECRELMASLDAPLPLDELGYLFPYESNLEVVQLLVDQLAGAPALLTPQRNACLYRVALHHICIHLFGWGHVSGQQMPVEERVKRLREVLPVTASPDLTKDVMNYSYVVDSEAAQAQQKQSAAPLPAPVAHAPVSAAAVVAPSSSAPPPTVPSPSLSAEQLASIEAARAQTRSGPPLVLDPRAHYGLLCPACSKPNSRTTTYCTGCAFLLSADDLARLPDNVFLDVVRQTPGVVEHNTVLYRDEEYVVLVDKFGTSVEPHSHVDCIPTRVIEDITALRQEDIPMLERLYQLGRAALLAQGDSLAWMPSHVPIDDLITAGFNCPVSVKHLHLHMVLPPFKHDRIFAYPRWHSYEKVVRDLREHGRVVLYAERPDPAEGQATYDRAIANSRRADQWVREWKEKQSAAEHKADLAQA